MEHEVCLLSHVKQLVTVSIKMLCDLGLELAHREGVVLKLNVHFMRQLVLLVIVEDVFHSDVELQHDVDLSMDGDVLIHVRSPQGQQRFAETPDDGRLSPQLRVTNFANEH